ncbi:autotransporter domain-containing protein [Candidatus Tisiphia endosymbiont of Ptychoptera albimana]|uniref:autotransporter outer membrane beta-barrel domain-containing protein n=1 Tax=Candidatus Tisiphia endosymbiont of Ptychoptera albimana TaxID=3066260 RepID=UPI00312CB96C
MSLRISILFNIGLTQLVLISTCKGEGGISPHTKFGESRLSPKILTSNNIVNTNTSFPDEEFDLENIQPLTGLGKSKSSSEILTSSNIINTNASFPNRKTDSENIPPFKGFGKSKSSSGILTSSNIVNTNTSFLNRKTDSKHILSKENTPPLKDSDKSNSSSEILASSNNTNASFTDEEFDLENIQPLTGLGKSKSSSKILTSSNIINTNASFPNRKTDSENIPPFKGFGKSKSSSGILTSSNIVNTNASFLNRKTDSKHILSKENTPPLKDSDKSNSSSEILASSNNTNASFTDEEFDLENIQPLTGLGKSKSSSEILTSSNIINTNASFLNRKTDSENIPPFKGFGKSKSSSEILASSNNTNASFTDKEIDLENILSKENTPPLTGFGISNRNQSRYFAFGADENRSPSLLTQESKESTLELPTIARRKVYRVRLPSQKGNQSLEEKKQMEIIAQNPNTMVSESSKEDVLGTVAATSSTEVKQWDATSPLPSHQSSGTNLGGSPTTSLAKYATSTPAEVSANLVLSPSNNSQSDTFRDYRDGRDPVLESPIKDITSTSNKQNNSSNISRALNPLFDNNGLKNTDLLSTDKSKSPSKILTNRNVVNEFEQNDTQSQKSNVLLNLNASSSDRELDSENIPPGGLYSQAKLDPYEGNALFSSKNKSGLYDPIILFTFPPEERPFPGVPRAFYKMSSKPKDSIFLAAERRKRLDNLVAKFKNEKSEDTIQELNQSPPDLSALDKTRDYSFLLEGRKKLDNLIAELKNTPLRDTKSYQSSGTNLGDSPTTSLAKYATSTPTEVPANLVLSPSNNSKSDTFRDYRDGRDPVLKSPIKDITSTSNKQNNPSNISRALKPLFDNNGLKNTDLLSTDNQLQKIQPCEDEEQGLISEFKNLSITDFPDLEASSSGATQLTLPTTAMMPNTTNHRNKLKKLKQRRKDNEFKQAMKKQEQRKKEEARITADKKQLLDMVKQMNKERRQQARAEQNNRAIEQQAIVQPTAQQLLTPETNKVPDVALIQNNIEPSIVSDGNGGEWREVVSKRQKRLNKKNIAKSIEVHTELVVKQNNGIIAQQSIVQPITQQLLTPETNKVPDVALVQNNIEPTIVPDENGGEWQEVLSKRQKRLNKKNIAKSIEVHTELVVKQNNGIIDQQSIVPKTFTQQPLTLETNKIPDYAFAQDKIEQSIVSDENGGEWQEVLSKRQKRLNKKNIAKSLAVQPEPPPIQPEPPAIQPEPPPIQPEPPPIQPKPPAIQPKPPETNLDLEGEEDYGLTLLFKEEESATSQTLSSVLVPTSTSTSTLSSELRANSLANSSSTRSNSTLENSDSNSKSELNNNKDSDQNSELKEKEEQKPNSDSELDNNQDSKSETPSTSTSTLSSELRANSLANSSSTRSNSTLENSDSNSKSELNNNKDSDQNSELKEKEEQKPNSKSELDNNQDSKSETPSSPVLKPNISADNDIASRNNSDALILQEQVKALEQQTVEVQKQVTSATINSVASVFDFIEQSVQSRFHQLDLAALASGDEDNIVSKNVWVSGTIGVAKYEGGNILSRYTGRTRAATIGGDIELQGGSIIGGAYNYVISNFKYKNRTDKVAAHAHVISIYGQTNLSDKLILQGVFSFALGNVSAKIPVQNQMAKAKFDNTSYSSKIVVAHKSQFGKVLITPNIGLKHGGYNIAGYNERFEAQSLSVAATNDRRASGIIGFEAVIPIKISDTTQVIPGLHMEGERFLHNKQQKVRMQITSGSNKREEVLLLEKPAKYNYKVGGTITIKRGVTEIMVVYDYLASNNKYSSHQGSIKLRVSF